ncbi:MAG: PaaI family thioesterase [Rhodospirillaceae bacterium]|nr:PaaI family thioesterase [Rhodospirillaceae bacterium]
MAVTTMAARHTLTLDEAQRIIAEMGAPCLAPLGFVVDAVADSHVRLRMPNTPALRHGGGVVCGQSIMSLADTAMVIGVSAKLGGFAPMTTVTQTTHFLRSIREGDVLAECRILRMGRNLAFGEVMIRAEGGIDPAVQVTSTYALLEKK